MVRVQGSHSASRSRGNPRGDPFERFGDGLVGRILGEGDLAQVGLGRAEHKLYGREVGRVGLPVVQDAILGASDTGFRRVLRHIGRPICDD